MDETRIVIVVDPEIGFRLRELADSHPTWIVSSPKNDELALTLREDGLREITTYTVRDTLDRTASVLGILPSIKMHHGEFSPVQYTSLLVCGIARSPALEEKLAEVGFGKATDILEDFVVERIQK